MSRKATIGEQLQELKRMQLQQQQELTRQQQEQRQILNVEQNKLFEVYQHDLNSELSIFDNSMHYHSPNKSQAQLDEMTFPPPKRNYMTLLEKELKDSTEVVPGNRQHIVKKPFLKKGDGLLRYMPNANSNKISKTPRARSSSWSSGITYADIRQPKSRNSEGCNSVPKSMEE